MIRTITVIAETRGDDVIPVTWEMLSHAIRLCRNDPTGVTALVPGARCAAAAETIARTAGVAVMAIENPGCAQYNPELWREMLYDSIVESRPVLILAAHTSSGYDFAPALAARLNSGCITAVESLRDDGGTVIAKRALAAGKLVMEINTHEGDVLTILPGSCPPDPFGDPVPGKVSLIKKDGVPQHIFPSGHLVPHEETGDIPHAEVIVAAGRGVGREENLGPIRALAALFSRSAVGGSRGVCDLGWLEYGRQIGLTGKTVAPKLYIACGISGSPQHIAGMKNSGTVVAVNTDPRAAIFGVADIGIVEDLVTFIPLLLEEVKKNHGNR